MLAGLSWSSAVVRLRHLHLTGDVPTQTSANWATKVCRRAVRVMRVISAPICGLVAYRGGREIAERRPGGPWALPLLTGFCRWRPTGGRV